MPDISFEPLSGAVREVWVAATLRNLDDLAEGCGFSKESEWYRQNLRVVMAIADGEYDA